MARRIEIELTSSKGDGTWTWRAAGARAPKGTVAVELLPGGAKVGDVLRADAEFFIDGISITSVMPPKPARRAPERLEIIGEPPSGQPETLAAAAPGEDRVRRRASGRAGREAAFPRGEGRARAGEARGTTRPLPGRLEPDQGAPQNRPSRRSGAERAEGPRRGPGQRPSRQRPEAPPMPAVQRPKVTRLRPGKAHRRAFVESLPAEKRPVAEQLLMGGLPAVRQAIEKHNAERVAAGAPPLPPRPLLEMAEELAGPARVVEWRDRAEAALRDVAELDLRDLRSVVSAADAAARDEDARELAAELRAALASRVDAEHAAWLAELSATLDVGRVVRALRLSSRPPKAGAPLPPELAARLVEATSESLTAEASADRWLAVLEALALSPVRDRVIPASLPSAINDDLRSAVARLGTRLPKIAHIFGIEPDPSPTRPARGSAGRSRAERARPRQREAGQAAPRPEAPSEAPSEA